MGEFNASNRGYPVRGLELVADAGDARVRDSWRRFEMERDSMLVDEIAEKGKDEEMIKVWKKGTVFVQDRHWEGKKIVEETVKTGFEFSDDEYW